MACVILWVVFGWNSPIVMYWLAMLMTLVMASGGDIALWLFITCAGYFLLTLIMCNKLIRTSAAKMVILSLFAGVLLCGMSVIGLVQMGPFGHREHISTVQLDNYTYNLHFYAPDYAESYSHHYVVYECLFNVFCTKIYTVLKSSGGITPDVETIELITDATAVYLQVNGSTVFTRSPKHLTQRATCELTKRVRQVDSFWSRADQSK